MTRKPDWGTGPWDNEPDEWHGNFNAFPVHVVRQEPGHLCGYVDVPTGHPWHSLGFDSGVLSKVKTWKGITYAEACENSPEWRVGFDCAHHGDLVPKYSDSGQHRVRYEVYRNFEAVRAQTIALARKAVASAQRKRRLMEAKKQP